MQDKRRVDEEIKFLDECWKASRAKLRESVKRLTYTIEDTKLAELEVEVRNFRDITAQLKRMRRLKKSHDATS